MSEILANVTREKGFVYSVDKNGNVVKNKYNIFKDPYTLVTLAIIILGGLYYLQSTQSATNVKNFDKYCVMYMDIRDDYVIANPTEIPTVEKVLKFAELNHKDVNISNLNYG